MAIAGYGHSSNAGLLFSALPAVASLAALSTTPFDRAASPDPNFIRQVHTGPPISTWAGEQEDC